MLNFVACLTSALVFQKCCWQHDEKIVWPDQMNIWKTSRCYNTKIFYFWDPRKKHTMSLRYNNYSQRADIKCSSNKVLFSARTRTLRCIHTNDDWNRQRIRQHCVSLTIHSATTRRHSVGAIFCDGACKTFFHRHSTEQRVADASFNTLHARHKAYVQWCARYFEKKYLEVYKIR